VAFSQDFVRFRIVLSKIGVNIRVSDMDGDVIPRCGQPSLIVGLPCRGDLNWSAFRRFDLSLGKNKRTGVLMAVGEGNGGLPPCKDKTGRD